MMKDHPESNPEPLVSSNQEISGSSPKTNSDGTTSGGSSSPHLPLPVDPSQQYESVKLEEVATSKDLAGLGKAFNRSSKKNLLPFQGAKVTPEEARKNYNTLLSGNLAECLWYTLGLIVILHFIAIAIFSWRLADRPAVDDKDHSERVKSAIASVNDTAKTLYTFLTPLATAVTGYYFTTIGASSKQSNSSDETEE